MKLLEIINEFTVNDIEKTINFYEEYLNFEVIETDGNPMTWVKMKKDDCTIMFEDYKEVCKEINDYPVKMKTSNLIKFKFDDKNNILKLYEKFVQNNIKVFMEYKITDYGSIEFGVLDPDENMIIISY